MTAAVVLDQQVRNGSYETGSVPVPTGNNPDTGAPWGFVKLASTMSDADALDLTKSCIITVLASWDGSLYQVVSQQSWAGGNRDKNGLPAPPKLNMSMPAAIDGSPPLRVMAKLDTVGCALNTGITIDFE